MTDTTTASRLYFLDWIRIFAFILLVFYHTGMYYVTWDWHIKSPFASDAIEPWMLLSSPWRLGLLFMISGVASSFMLHKMRAGAFLRQRSARLLIPLVFGMIVIVPPQSYFQVVEALAYQGGYLDFMRLYLSGYHGFCKGDCLILPTWNHLWFVMYLWIYTLLLAAIVLTMGARFERVSAALARWLTGWKIIVLPLAVLAVLPLALAARFPATHALIDDWYNNANYFALFLLGAMLARQRDFWPRLEPLRWYSLGLALTGWAALKIYYSIPDAVATEATMEQWRPAMRVVYASCQWTPILAACGFGHRHLQFDSAARRYLTQAVFPVYILHQTLIICMAHALKPLRLAPLVEGTILIVLTLTISFGIYDIVRRVRPLQAVFGVGRAQAGVMPRQERSGRLRDAPQMCTTGGAPSQQDTADAYQSR